MKKDSVLPIQGSGEGFVAAEWKPIFDRSGIRTQEDFFSISGRALSKPGLGKRYRAQLDLTKGDENVLVFYKRYDGEKWKNFFQRWFEDRKNHAIACREVVVANALKEIGIPTFQPLAWGSTRNSGANQKSFIVMSQVPGVSVEKWLANKTLDWTEKLALVEQVARLAKRVHENGWFHRDFYLCHIFLDDSSGDYQLALVDLARMFRPRFRNRRWRIKDLSQLNFSAGKDVFSRTMRLRFAKLYLGANRLSQAHKAFLRQIAKRSESIARREMRKGR